jgi:thiosulfate dehydrogenase (quinone) large subunit
MDALRKYLDLLRKYVLPIAGIAAVLLIYLENPWNAPTGNLRLLITLAFWVLAIALAVTLVVDSRRPAAQYVDVEGPGFTRFLFGNTQAGLFWLPIRLFVGFEWLSAGTNHFNNPAWTSGGTAIAGFWNNAVVIPEAGRPPITFEWWRGFLQVLIDNNAAPWFSWLIILGEIAVGLGLLFGALTGFAAFFGLVMNMSFMLSGSASTNPVLFAMAIGLILAWRVAGWYGIDRYLLPRLGTPWSRIGGARAPGSTATT